MENKVSQPPRKLPADAISWPEHIVIDPQVMAGRPTIKGTEITVDLILERLAAGWTQRDLRASHPQLTDEAMRAVFALVAQRLRDLPRLEPIDRP